MKNIQRLLAIFAHPDDESYRAGGALALLALKGAQVSVVCATRGEQGILKMDPVETGQVRQTEMECACRALGIEPPLYPRRLDFFLKDRAFRIDKAKRVLGWQPQVNLDDGIRQTLDWYRREGWL